MHFNLHGQKWHIKIYTLSNCILILPVTTLSNLCRPKERIYYSPSYKHTKIHIRFKRSNGFKTLRIYGKKNFY